MTELEKMQRAKMYIDKMAAGINPVTGEYVSENDTLNNVRIARCLFYVSEILSDVIENGGRTVKKQINKMSGKEPFSLSDEERGNFQFSEKPIPIKVITDKINMLIDTQKVNEIKYRDIAEWLIEIGILENISTEINNKVSHRKLPTAKARNIGIITEKRTGHNGTYTAVLYNIDAQHFIIDNIDEIIRAMNNKNSKKTEDNTIGKTWSDYEKEFLTDLFLKHKKIPEIAVSIKRSETEVIEKLRELGYI